MGVSARVSPRALGGMSLVVEGSTLVFRSAGVAALPGEMIPRGGGRLASREGPTGGFAPLAASSRGSSLRPASGRASRSPLPKVLGFRCRVSWARWL